MGSNSEARKRLAGAVVPVPGAGLTDSEVAALRFGAGMILTDSPEPEEGEQPCVEREVAAGLVRALDELAAVDAERAELLARLQQREADHAAHPAEEASEGDTGICRTCTLPIVFATVEEPGYLPRTGWSDGARRDALVCFKAVGYRHVPLVGRERAIWDRATSTAEPRLREVEARLGTALADVADLTTERDRAVSVAAVRTGQRDRLRDEILPAVRAEVAARDEVIARARKSVEHIAMRHRTTWNGRCWECGISVPKAGCPTLIAASSALAALDGTAPVEGATELARNSAQQPDEEAPCEHGYVGPHLRPTCPGGQGDPDQPTPPTTDAEEATEA